VRFVVYATAGKLSTLITSDSFLRKSKVTNQSPEIL